MRPLWGGVLFGPDRRAGVPDPRTADQENLQTPHDPYSVWASRTVCCSCRAAGRSRSRTPCRTVASRYWGCAWPVNCSIGAVRDHAHPYTAETLTDSRSVRRPSPGHAACAGAEPRKCVARHRQPQSGTATGAGADPGFGLKSAFERLASFCCRSGSIPMPENLLAVPLSRREIAELLRSGRSKP